MSEDRFQLQRLLEAILFASAEPLTVDALAARMPEGADIPGLLQEIRDLYANRGVNLTPVEDRWCFRTAPDLSSKFHIEQKVERKLTRAAIETLAIIAYHQPVTRAEIEEIRGVAISKGTLDNLLEAGWIKPKGRRQTPGRPVTWVTTEGFLEHFGLESCDALPGIEELRAAGLLDSTANAATLGVQGHLPPGGGDGEGEEGDEDGDEQGVADDAYDAEMLARLEGEAAETGEARSEARETAEGTDGEIAADELAGGFEPVDIAEPGVDDEDLDEADLDGEEDEPDEESELEEELENEAFEEDVAEEEAAVALHDVNDDDGEEDGDSPDDDDEDNLDDDDLDEDDVDEEDGDDEDEDDAEDEDELEDDDLEDDDLDEADDLDEDEAGEADEGDGGEGDDDTRPADRKLDAG